MATKTKKPEEKITTVPGQSMEVTVKPQAEPVLNVESLIARAIDKGISVDVMERLLAMREKLNEEYAKKEFIKALSAFQGDCPIIEKKNRVDFNTTHYSYAPLEVIVDQVKALLTKNGFSYMFDTETNGKMRVVCNVYHSAGHMKTTRFDIEVDNSDRNKMNISQKYGSALTYAKRYAFCAAFGINVKDEDTDMANEEKTQPVPQQPHTTLGIFITPKQRGMIQGQLKRIDKNEVWLTSGIKNRYGIDNYHNLSLMQASEVIEGLLKMPDVKKVTKGEKEPDTLDKGTAEQRVHDNV